MKGHRQRRTPIAISKGLLARLRVRALRRRMWYQVLSRLERASVDLTIQVVDRVRSPVLAKSLISVVQKLVRAMESPVARLMREVGSSLARQASHIAQQWGHRSAQAWQADLRFIRYLAVMQLNTSPMFGA